jgi:tetratricopeptide (TPR) repeat protein
MEPEKTIDLFQLALFFAENGLKAMRGSDLATAAKAFEAALKVAEKVEPQQAQLLRTLITCCQCCLKERSGQTPEARRLREDAMPLVEAIAPEDQSVVFNHLMLDVLFDLKEYWRAIPFCERVILQSFETEGGAGIIELLSTEAYCYLRSGLKDEAAIPLRAALKILRDRPGDPRLPSVLIDLASALRKSSPVEAEQLYKEAASTYEAKAQLQSATVPWVNLGILCSEQGRHDESLAYYERALHIRENSSSTRPQQLGLLLNNMACCYRRMDKFDEALRLADRAIEILEPIAGPTLASAYGTRGQILHHAGEHQEAVVWLQKSYAERQKAPNPDIEALIENLELEIKSLQSLGRVDEVHRAQEKLAKVKSARKQAPHANINLPSAENPEGAILIELRFGRNDLTRHSVRDVRTVADQISAILDVRKLGSYGGGVVIAESTTLIFHGPDAQQMFSAIQQFLSDHLIFAGATVAIRQGTQLRSIVVPQIVN